MANPMEVTLRLAPGAGRIVRRPTALLFVPESGDDELIKIFSEAASDSGAVDEVCKHAVAANFSINAFAIVAWADSTKILVFGDLAVATDQASAPMISGAGSATWVEHTLRGVPGDVAVSVLGDEVDPVTRLDSGVANARGFSLLGSVATSPSPPPSAAAPASPAPFAKTPLTSPFDAESPGSAPEAVEPPAVAAAQLPVLPLSGPTPTPPRPAADLAAAPVVEAPPAPQPLEDPFVANAADAPPAPVAEPVLPPAPVAAPLAAAPLVAAAPILNADATPEAAAPSGVVLPSLELDSGDIIELSAPVLIGRRPDPSAYPHVSGLVGHKLKGEKLSRSHVIVRATPTGVAVCDCESLNGTIVVHAPGATPRRIAPGKEVALDSGATIHFGDEAATVVVPH